MNKDILKHMLSYLTWLI